MTAAEKKLKGANVESLERDTPEGIKLKPVYCAADLERCEAVADADRNAPGLFPYHRLVLLLCTRLLHIKSTYDSVDRSMFRYFEYQGIDKSRSYWQTNLVPSSEFEYLIGALGAPLIAVFLLSYSLTLLLSYSLTLGCPLDKIGSFRGSSSSSRYRGLSAKAFYVCSTAIHINSRCYVLVVWAVCIRHIGASLACERNTLRAKWPIALLCPRHHVS